MSADIQPVEQFVNPTTGELLSLASPDGDLGRYLADIRDLEGQIREHKKIVTRELLSRMDRAASWTVYDAGLKLSGASPAPSEEWDGFELYQALCAFADEGKLTMDAVNAAVECHVMYKARKAGISALRKLGGEIAQTVDELARVVEKDRRITVSRS